MSATVTQRKLFTLQNFFLVIVSKRKNFRSKYHTGENTKKNVYHISSVKWSVLAHLKSQPRGQNFQAQI